MKRPHVPPLVRTLLAINLFNGVATGALALVLPLYAVSLGASAGQVGLLGTVQWIGVLLVSVPAGAVVGMWGWGRLYGAGSAMQGILLLALPLVGGPAALSPLAALASTGRTVGHVSVGSTLLGELALLGDDKAGWHRASFSLGMTFLGPLIGGAALVTLGARSTLVALGVAVLLVAAAASRVADARRLASVEDARAIMRRRLSDLRRLVRRPHLLRAFAIEGIVNAAMAVYATFAPLFVTRSLGGTSATIGVIAAGQGLCYVTMLLFGGPLLLRLGRAGQYALGGVLSAAAFALLALASDVRVAAVASLVLGAGLAAISFATFAILGAEPEDKGAVFGAFGLVMAAFVMFAPLGAGVVGDVVGVRGVFAGGAPLFLGLSAYLLVAHLRSERASTARVAVAELPAE